MDAPEFLPGSASPREILDRLEARYRELFEAAGTRGGKPKITLTGILDRWLRSPAPSEPEPMFTEFLKDVDALVKELAEALAGADAGERDASALDAARIMLASKPVNEKSQAEWYMVAAEFSFEALIPLIAPDTLKAIRDGYVRGTPKRVMFPRQRDLLKRMEQGLR